MAPPPPRRPLRLTGRNFLSRQGVRTFHTDGRKNATKQTKEDFVGRGTAWAGGQPQLGLPSCTLGLRGSLGSNGDVPHAHYRKHMLRRNCCLCVEVVCLAFIICFW